MERAPLLADIDRGPPGGEAWWLAAAGGVRIRAAAWPAKTGLPPRGTVLIFPGRTEYIEKFSVTAAAYAGRGYAVASIDWRGQGLADRACKDPRLGHVGDFAEFQDDVDALVNFAQWLDLPEPWFLLAHSMGGCIGLRALQRGLAVRAAAFSSPMWGIAMSPALRPAAWAMAHAGPALGLGCLRTPGSDAETYAATAPFEDNTLTSDPEGFAYLAGQLHAHPELLLAGPTLSWFRAALREMRALNRMAPPKLPAIAFAGSHERIVDLAPIRAMMARWPDGTLEEFPGAEHEILMEKPAVRARVLDATTTLFEAA